MDHGKSKGEIDFSLKGIQEERILRAQVGNNSVGEPCLARPFSERPQHLFLGVHTDDFSSLLQPSSPRGAKKSPWHSLCPGRSCQPQHRGPRSFWDSGITASMDWPADNRPSEDRRSRPFASSSGNRRLLIRPPHGENPSCLVGEEPRAGGLRLFTDFIYDCNQVSGRPGKSMGSRALQFFPGSVSP